MGGRGRRFACSGSELSKLAIVPQNRTVDIIAELCNRYGVEHGLSWFRSGVAAEVHDPPFGIATGQHRHSRPVQNVQAAARGTFRCCCSFEMQLPDWQSLHLHGTSLGLLQSPTY